MTDNGRYRLHGDCTVCGMHKNIFTSENWIVKTRNKKELLEARERRQQSAFNRKAKKLGLKILNADEDVQACVKRCLRTKKED
jgi:hypothetical protein